MSRVRTLLTVIMPSMIAGGLVFGSAFTYAAAGRDDAGGLWLVSADTASTSDPEIRRARPTRTAQAPQ
ncbi:MAG: hypothetical protein H0T89_13295, partial [Deltaproteobacteria bacterium]|nr:hypothetical protein [Deltaproteobacteria bacterium]